MTQRAMTRQRGFSIIAVIFILVVLAGLGVVIAQLGATQHLGALAAQDGRQAWYAARAGLEAGRSEAMNDACTGGGHTFEGFDVEVRCTSQEFQEGEATLTVYYITSIATAASGPLGTIRREARMLVWRRS